MNENDYTNNKIEVKLSEIVELALKQKEEERRNKLAAEAKNLETIEETPAGEKLTWNVTPEQIARINAGDHAALESFYFDPSNYQRLISLAYRFMRHNCFLFAVVSWEDLMQQVYCDLLTGMAKLRPFDRAISRVIFHSFQYAAVGGLEEVFIPRTR